MNCRRLIRSPHRKKEETHHRVTNRISVLAANPRSLGPRRTAQSLGGLRNLAQYPSAELPELWIGVGEMIREPLIRLPKAASAKNGCWAVVNPASVLW